ncbi:fibroblast growth factor receptor-like 1 [Physella acuta]|uniref:fibroblast growth factor receptor-like 1 n=1 Tax=Physella acuta TaxID=109671 RepID=UPI0027DC6FEA|nr:fibroblast growth factor receptor-like 1 [Physella acuta]XP_059138484.1 fibroblast growth factor receptor-like 1 [Physella acuta]
MGSVTVWQGLLLLQVVVCSLPNIPPSLTGKAWQRVLVKLGKNHKLSCGAENFTPYLTDWKKDGQSINPGWERFKITNEGDLRIRDIEKTDAGLYTCIATNGFGMVSVNHTFIVQDDERQKFYDGDKEYNITADEDLTKDGAIPFFEDLEQMKKSMNMEKPVRSIIKLICKADGNPKPEITWIRNEKPIPQKRGHGHAMLKINDVTKADSGAYMCVAHNRLGQVNFTFNIQVIDVVNEKPKLIAPHPLNQTVDAGSTVSFQCFVESENDPEVKWLKRVDRPEEGIQDTVLDYGNEKFIVLKNPGAILKLPDGTYLHKLVIKNVRAKDAGLFVCSATNKKGFNTRQAYLHIVPGSESNEEYSDDTSTSHGSSNKSSDDADTNLPLYIGLPSCAVLVLILLAVFLMQRNNRCRRADTSSKSPRPPVPPHERDAFYYSNCQQQQQTVNPLLASREKIPPKTPAPSVDMACSEFSSVSRAQPNHYYHPNHMNYGY